MQIQLFGRPLFNETLLKRYLSEKKLEAIPQYNQRLQALKEWKRAVKQGYVEKETSVEQRFNGLIFEQVLGYSLHPSPQVSAWAKPPSKLTGISREPDLIMGSGLDTDEPDISAVVELKTPRTKLDMPQYRKDRKTPVEQAFSYGLDILGVRWVIATNMRYFRLYSVDWQDSYEDFDLFRCAEGGDEFKRFFYLLHHQYLVGSMECTLGMRHSVKV